MSDFTVEFAMLARAATIANNEFFIHGGGLRAVDIPEVPVAFPIGVAAKIVSDPSHVGETHTFAMRLFRPDGTPLWESPVQDFTIAPLDVLVGEDQLSLLVAIAIGGVPIESPGEYRFVLFLDEEELATLPLRVTVQGASGPIAS